MDFGLKGKKVFVQGSSSGLGFAIAKAYAEEGAKVAICSRDASRAKQASSKIPHSIYLAGDLDQEGMAKELIQEGISLLGGIDILVTNTGGPPAGVFSHLARDEWQKGFDRVFLSAVESILEVLPFMKKNQWGRILLNTSVSAKEPILSLTVSTALRAGLLGLMKAISQEVAKDCITVNALLPGYTQTERLQELKIPEEQLVRDIPAQRLGKPEELAALAVFLGSEQASYITGQAIANDGGWIKGI